MQTYRNTTTDMLTLSTKPLTFRNEGNAIALLMHSKVAPVTEDDGVRVLAITVIANCAFTILLFASTHKLAVAVYCCSGA